MTVTPTSGVPVTSSSSSPPASQASAPSMRPVLSIGAMLVALMAIWSIHTDPRIPWQWALGATIGIAACVVLPAPTVQDLARAVIDRLPWGRSK